MGVFCLSFSLLLRSLFSQKGFPRVLKFCMGFSITKTNWGEKYSPASLYNGNRNSNNIILVEWCHPQNISYFDVLMLFNIVSWWLLSNKYYSYHRNIVHLWLIFFWTGIFVFWREFISATAFFLTVTQKPFFCQAIYSYESNIFMLQVHTLTRTEIVFIWNENLVHSLLVTQNFVI